MSGNKVTRDACENTDASSLCQSSDFLGPGRPWKSRSNRLRWPGIVPRAPVAHQTLRQSPSELGILRARLWNSAALSHGRTCWPPGSVASALQAPAMVWGRRVSRCFQNDRVPSGAWKVKFTCPNDSAIQKDPSMLLNLAARLGLAGETLFRLRNLAPGAFLLQPSALANRSASPV